MHDSKLTIKEIARLAGVSIGTVDRVLHGRTGVSTETSSRIQGIIAAGDYKPDIMARQLSLKKGYTFRAIMPLPGQDSGYWALCRGGLSRAAKDLSAYRVTIKIDDFDRYDRVAYADILAGILADPGDGLLVAPVLPAELKPFLDRLPPDLPYAFFDGICEDTAPRFAIYQNAFEAGHLAGRILSMLAGFSGGPYIVINAHGEDLHIRHRIEGFSEYFRLGNGRASSASKVVVRECFDIDDPVSRESFMRKIFAEFPDVAGILVVNSSGHYVGKWLASEGRKGDCPLVSWDLVPENAAALTGGGIDCILSQRPEEQTRMGMELLFKAVASVASPANGSLGTGNTESHPHHFVPIDVFFRENAAYADPYNAG